MELLSLDDPLWRTFHGGCRAPFDVVPLIRQLNQSGPSREFWGAVWEELHHQGDVGEASYALVPYLAAWQASAQLLDEQLFHFVAVIELARPGNKNPPLPAVIAAAYHQALRRLATSAAEKIPETSSASLVKGVTAVYALVAGCRMLARAYLDLGRDEAVTFLRDLYGFEPATYDL